MVDVGVGEDDTKGKHKPLTTVLLLFSLQLLKIKFVETSKKCRNKHVAPVYPGSGIFCNSFLSECQGEVQHGILKESKNLVDLIP